MNKSEEITPPKGVTFDMRHAVTSQEIQEDPMLRAVRKIVVDATELLRDDLAARLDKATKKLAPRWVLWVLLAFFVSEIALWCAVVYILMR